MLQVDQASHFDRDIAQRYPTGTQFVGPCAQVDQVVVSARAVAIARVGEAHDLSLMQVGLSLQKLLIEVPETGHGAEILELLRTDDIKERFRSRRDGLKEMTTEVQNDVSIKEPLQPEVAILSKLFPQLLQWQACIGRLEPTQSLRCHLQCIAIADQWLDERSHAIEFLSKGAGAGPKTNRGAVQNVPIVRASARKLCHRSRRLHSACAGSPTRSAPKARHNARRSARACLSSRTSGSHPSRRI